MTDSRAQIERLMLTYADLQDRGDFDGVGALFAHAVFERGDGKQFRGAEVAEHRKRVNVTYDGSPNTRHVTTNVSIDVDEAAGTATAQAYYMVVQETPDLPLQVIVAGRYDDRFERAGGEWRFAYRKSHTDLIGQMRGHRQE
jgi:3-phenylpropionate/cinnamic acid dioxygenase small subunit